MADFTLLKVDVDVGSVTAKAHAYAPFAKAVHEGTPEVDEDGEPGTGATVEVEESDGGRSKAKLAAALVGLLFLVVAAVVLRRRFTEGDEDDEIDDVDRAEVAIE